MKMPPIGKNIKKIRKAAKLTQAELADRIGYARAYLGNVETERDTPSINILQKIAEALNTPIKKFFEEEMSDPLETRLDLNSKEENLIKIYRKLDDCNRYTIEKMLMFLSSPQNTVGNVNIQSSTQNSKIFNGNNNNYINM